jgi:hypothetical protein
VSRNSSGEATVTKTWRLPSRYGLPLSQEGVASARELIDRELDRMPRQELDKMLSLLRILRDARVEAALPLLAAESALNKDWLSPEEDAAWANL